MQRINEDLAVIEKDAQKLIQCRCGHVLGPVTNNYKEHTLKKESPLSEAGPFVNPYNIGGGRFVFRQFCCPDCAILLGTEIALQGAPLLWDIQVKG